ncbi:MAG: hypothetical protein ACTTJ1_09180 [Treponema sp.]
MKKAKKHKKIRFFYDLIKIRDFMNEALFFAAKKSIFTDLRTFT